MEVTQATPAPFRFTGKVLASFVVRFAILLVALAGVLFLSAGRVDIWQFWAYIAVTFLGMAYNVSVIVRTDASLLAERVKPGPGGKDPHLRIISMVAFLGMWIIAGLDVGRFQWSPPMSYAMKVAGLTGLMGALAISTWAMATNRFFSSDVRIQSDRGHHLITGGPYQYVRHPGYVGAVLMGLSAPLALGSWWSAAAILPALVLIIRRLRIEERLLSAELEGYAEYMQKVRYRLLPGVW